VRRLLYTGLAITAGAEHQPLQPAFLELSSNSEHRVAKYSSHTFNDYDPWLVIDEIKSLVGRLAGG
jgi:hypothetical protein